MTRLSLAAADREALIGAAKQSFPNEVCGVLLGRRYGDERVDLVELIAGENRAGSGREHAYVLDPGALLEAELAARRRGLEVLGLYHSHPHAAAVPSLTDLDTAVPSWFYLIVSLADEAVLRAWCKTARSFREEEIVYR